MSFIRNQAVTGLPDTSYRMRVSEGKRWDGVVVSAEAGVYLGRDTAEAGAG